MTKKLLLAFLLTLLSVSTMFFLSKKANASALSELSYASSSNVVDVTNLSVTSQIPVQVKTIKNIYLSNKDYVFFQFYTNGGGLSSIQTMDITFYDVDGISLGTNTLQTQSFTLVNGSDSKQYITYKYEDIPNRAFSFAFRFTAVSPTFLQDCYVMAFLGSDVLRTSYIEFSSHAPLIDLSLSSSPIIEVSYDAPLSHDDLVELVGCVDGYEGNKKSNVSIVDSSYLQDTNTLQTHEITVSSTDGSNTAQGKFYLKVVDNQEPVITGKDKVSFPVQTTVSLNDILSQYTAIDGHDGDLTSSLALTSEYTPGSNTVKTDEIVLKSVDNSGNIALKNISVSYYDNIAPTYTGPETVTLSYQVVKTLDQILDEYFTISDNVTSSENIARLFLINQYAGHEGKPGTYNVFIRIADESLNTAYINFNIIVSDEIKPVIFIDTYSIETTTSVSLSKLDFDDLLYSSGVLQKGRKYTAIVLADTYTGHESEKGTYVYKVQYIDNESGDSIEKTFKIDVGYDTYTISTQPNKGLEKPAIIGIIATSILTIAGVAGVIFIGKKDTKKRNQ